YAARTLSRPRPPTGSTLFPYTTLFRSLKAELEKLTAKYERAKADLAKFRTRAEEVEAAKKAAAERALAEKSLEEQLAAFKAKVRSEEHTSELQSRENLVCRLLLEKKKK